MSASEFQPSLHGYPRNANGVSEPPDPSQTLSSPLSRDDITSDANPIADRSIFSQQATTSVGENTELWNGPHGTSESRTSLVSRTSLDGPVPTFASNIPQIRIDPESEQVTPTIGDADEGWPLPNPKLPQHTSQHTETNGSMRNSFRGIPLDIPAGQWGDDFRTNTMQFSNRGSMFIDGRKVSPATSESPASLQRPTMGTQRVPTSSSVPDRLPLRVMSTDEEVLSEKVRSYYAVGSDVASSTDAQSDMANKIGQRWQSTLGTDAESTMTASRAPSFVDQSSPQSPATVPAKPDAIAREEMELAGGLEDWQDVDNADVDRYGFIIPKSPTSPTSSAPGVKRSGTVSGQGLQRVSTSLQLASETPRRKRTLRSSGSSMKDGKRSTSDALTRTISNQSTARPSSSKSTASHRHSPFRAASNRLPGNKDRRLMDEASDMLTLPHSLTSGPLTRTATVESDQSGRSGKAKANLETKAASAASRKKELEREEKWRKMARATPSTSSNPDHKGIGGGMLFSFPPVSDAKLVSRTWKGIPDTWRAPAWHYFLSVSARKNPQSLPDDQLIKTFYDYQEINSPDDVQIDIDVPRTISSHIMFRRRYRGGQRLLFRVLHAMSIHWPETGYVQGMAALAATLLSYYEEEKAFVMLVRLWECRGLGKLYKEGFGGLMEALNDFEGSWLGEGEVAKKLIRDFTSYHDLLAVATDLNIFPTAYGTRWYLTLFNYSIPFPAQLRVWDVFMLLGDNETPLPPAATANAVNDSSPNPPSSEDLPFGTTLDVLHATSAALIDGMRDILLASDFENGMKVLTSWIPIRDEDLFMRVARAEWKMHREKRRKK